MGSKYLLDDDYDNLPGINIFDARVDDIWKETLEVQDKEFHVVEEDVKDDSKSLANKKSKRRKKIVDSQNNSRVTLRSAKKKVEHVQEETLSDSEGNNEEIKDNVKLSRSAKRRLEKLEWETKHDSQRVEKQSKLVFDKLNLSSSPLKEDIQVLELPNRDIFLKIRYNSKISKMKVKIRDKFQVIYPKVADMFGLKSTEILLCRGDDTIKLTDTAESIKLGVLDVIDCLPCIEEVKKGGFSTLLLKFQSNDMRKRIELYVHKLEKFHDIVKKYAALRELNVENLTFEFDGESIPLDETPLDLEMESGSCIDVKVSNSKQIRSDSYSFEHAKSIPPIKPMNIIELD